jgi:hypothetical protein
MCDDGAAGQQQHAAREPYDFVYIVRDVQDWDAESLRESLDVGRDLPAARGIERGERLIHEQEPRIREQRARDCRPLLLASRERRGPAAEQRLNPSAATASRIAIGPDSRACAAAKRKLPSTVRCGNSLPS